MCLNFENKIDLCTPDTLLTEYGAKTYTDDKPNYRLHLQLTQEFDLDAYILSVYPFITFVAAYAEADCMAGYVKSEMQDYDAFAIKNGIAHWQQDQKIVIDENKKLDYYELVALGTKIRFGNGNEVEKMIYKELFSKNILHPNGIELLERKDLNGLSIEDTIAEILNNNQ
jgi:hypothetical protein